jgi:serine/threonine protein phosphatase PrpC
MATTKTATLTDYESSAPRQSSSVSPIMVSSHEEMNPSRRSAMEDCSVYAPPGTWDAPDEDMAYLGVYDGHGGM